jgi:DNA-binding response OmpR family regulator
MRILIIEDQEDLREALQSGLEAKCFSVDVAEDGEHGSFLARTNDYDVILLDYMLPKANGKQVCEEIRKAGRAAYIIMLTVRSEVEDKIDRLNTGADDYLTKPYSFDELFARIGAVLRRPKPVLNETLVCGDLQLSTSSCSVKRAGEDIYLTRKEFMLLEYLLRNQGNVVTRVMLAEHVWNSNLDPFSNTIESHILTLRRKLNPKDTASVIQTVSGRGYKIVAPDPEPAAA